MSIAANAISERPIGADPSVQPKGRTPDSRTMIASADVVQQPEAR